MQSRSWRVCERGKDFAGREKIFYLGAPCRGRDDAEKERERMLALPEYAGRNLGVSPEPEPPRKRKLRNPRRRVRR